MTTKTTMKSLARSLGKALKTKGHIVPHSVLLHAIAASGGETNWHVVAQKSEAGAEKAPNKDWDWPIRGALMSCVDMLQECLQHTDNDTADAIDTVLISAQAALKAELTPAPTHRLILAVQQVLGRWEQGDLAQAVRELDAALKETLAHRASTPASTALAAAAQELLDAFGGNTPDWLRSEAIKLENALTAEKQNQPLDHWGEDHGYPLEDWRYEVANGDTRLGYWQWVAKRKDEDEQSPPSEAAKPAQHVCGLTGYNPMVGDTCPGCESDAAKRAALNAPYSAIQEVQRRADARMRKVAELLEGSKGDKQAEQPADPECECDNCGEVWLRSELNEAKDLDERLDYPIGHPDCIEPDGECPDCGALCYEIEEELEQPSLLLAARDVVADYDGLGCEGCGVVTQSYIDALQAAYDAWGPGPVQETALVAATRAVLENYDTTGCEGCGTVPWLHHQQLEAAVMSLRK